MSTLTSEPVLLAIIAAAAGIIGGAGIWSVVIKRMNRDVDSATARAQLATANKDEVTALREVLAEMREERGYANAKIETFERKEAEREERVSKLEKRMTEQEVKLEQRDEKIRELQERERHALTRAGVHEAWDQMSFALLAASHPEHPPPPPIRDPIYIEATEHPVGDSEVSSTRRTRTSTQTSTQTTTTDDGTGP